MYSIFLKADGRLSNAEKRSVHKAMTKLLSKKQNYEIIESKHSCVQFNGGSDRNALLMVKNMKMMLEWAKPALQGRPALQCEQDTKVNHLISAC